MDGGMFISRNLGGLPWCVHTCLTRWAKWMDPFTFHRVAGHADMKTTMRYVHPSDADMDEAIMKAREVQAGHTSRHTEQDAASSAPN